MNMGHYPRTADSSERPLARALDISPVTIWGDLAAREPRDRNNLIWMVLAAAGAPLAGSFVSVLMWAAFVWAFPSLAFGHISVKRDRFIFAAAVAAGGYAAIVLAFTIAHSGFIGWRDWLTTLIFFAPLLVASRMKMTKPETTLDVFVLAAGFSTIVALPVAAYQTLWLGLRATAFCGNPGVFAVMSLLFGSIGTLNIVSPSSRRRVLGAAAYLTMTFCVLASGMRTIWIAMPFVTLVILWAARREIAVRSMRRVGVVVLLVIATGLIIFAEPVWQRLAQIDADLGRMEQQQDYSTSTGRRILMLQGGWEAVTEAPLAGHGIIERMPSVRAHLPPAQRKLIPFTHPHNGFLAALIDAGVIGLVAVVILLATPFAIGLAGPRDAGRELRIAIGAILTLTYSFTGAFNILFQHDLMDSAFVLVLILLAAMTPVTVGPARSRL